MKGKLLLGALAVFSAGALIGVLLTSEKGSKTRKKYAKKGEDYLKELKCKYEDLLDRMDEKYASIKNNTV
jgi:hypothetical protein